MDVTAQLDAACSPAEMFAVVEDLSRYPDWLEIVPRVEAGADELDEEQAWLVELRGRLGPLARSKRLRMVRTEHDRDGRRVRFERSEQDGRSHSPWVLAAQVDPGPDGARLEMRLHYGGGFGGVLLERMLRDEITKSRPRLRALLESDA